MNRQVAREEEVGLTGVVDGEYVPPDKFTSRYLLAATAKGGWESTVASTHYLGKLGKALVFNHPPRILEGVLAFGRSLFDIAGYMMNLTET